MNRSWSDKRTTFVESYNKKIRWTGGELNDTPRTIGIVTDGRE